MTETRYKFLEVRNNQLMSSRGNQRWIPGAWYEVKGEVQTCYGSAINGFHCSKRMGDALGYVKGEAVALVEVAGEYDAAEDKEAWQKMRLIDVRQWRKEDSVALAIFAAELVIEIFERAVPGDDRPRKAIEAAKAYLENPTAAARAYARAYACAAAARAAARAYACAAADAAAYAAYAAAYAAAAAAAYAAAAAAAAADADLRSKISDWMEARFETLPKYEG